MEHDPTPSYTSVKLEMRTCPEKGGLGLFTREAIKAGELLCVWGGEIVTQANLRKYPHHIVEHGIQIEEEVYLIPLVVGDPGDYVNHSCEPNAGIRGQISLVAMRDISKGEEICFDYAMSDSSDYDEFECHCGMPNCRKRVSGNDWKIPAIQKKYKGYFSTYLQRRIDLMNKNNNGHKDELEPAGEDGQVIGIHLD